MQRKQVLGSLSSLMTLKGYNALAHIEKARSIAQFAEAAAHEAARKEKSAKLLELSARGPQRVGGRL